jgi:hypothetical protein
MLAAGSPLKSHQECGGVELNPRFSVQMEAAAAAAAKAATSPKRTKKSPVKKSKKKQPTDERKATIPRLWTDEVSLSRLTDELHTPDSSERNLSFCLSHYIACFRREFNSIRHNRRTNY